MAKTVTRFQFIKSNGKSIVAVADEPPSDTPFVSPPVVWLQIEQPTDYNRDYQQNEMLDELIPVFISRLSIGKTYLSQVSYTRGLQARDGCLFNVVSVSVAVFELVEDNC